MFGFIKKAVKSAGKVVKAVTKPVAKLGGNKFVQAAVPVLAINSSITASTVRGGPKAGFRAAEAALKNPVMRKAGALTAMAFPAAAPVVAMQEAAIRTLDAMKSKNPQLAAGAALQVAATFAGAKTNPEMARAAKTLKAVARARTLVNAAANATGGTKARLEAEVARNPAAQLYALRQLATKNTPAAARARAELSRLPNGRKVLESIQKAVVATPKTVQVRQFTVDRSGRVRRIKDGRLLRG